MRVEKVTLEKVIPQDWVGMPNAQLINILPRRLQM